MPAGAVVLATGVTYRRLDVAGLAALTGAGVFYGAAWPTPTRSAARTSSSSAAATRPARRRSTSRRFAAQVTILVRGESLAATMSRYLSDAIDAAPQHPVRHYAEVVGGGGRARLEHLTIRDRESGVGGRGPRGALFILIGAVPRPTGCPRAVSATSGATCSPAAPPCRHGGRWPLGRAAACSSTSVPGIFAVGDVRSGAVKRVASAVGEGRS